MLSRGRAVAFGLLVDALVGEPPPAAHPVAWFGRAMQGFEQRRYRDSRAAGAAQLAAGLTLALWGGRALGSTVGATFLAVGGRALRDSALGVGRALEAGDLDAARRLLPSLVGRDTDGLSEKEVARAAVESVAENTTDAVVAPALWAVVSGAPGALAYRAVNTLDAMFGHRTPRYERYGWASARADDAMGWVPARATAALVALVRPGRAREVLTAVRRDARAHPSPNAGVSEAAFAAALGLRLGGRNAYGGRVELRPPLGGGRSPEPGDIRRACALSADVTVALGLCLLA